MYSGYLSCNFLRVQHGARGRQGSSAVPADRADMARGCWASADGLRCYTPSCTLELYLLKTFPNLGLQATNGQGVRISFDREETEIQGR